MKSTYWCMEAVAHLLFLIIVFLGRETVHGIDYGPSITSLTGVYLNWKGPSLLALDSGKRIVLEELPNYSVVIPLASGSPSATSQQVFQERVISTVGEFMVEAPKGYGVMAVIQELSLRRNRRERGKTLCSDYIQFGELLTDSTGARTGAICGDVIRGDPALKPRGLKGPRVFHSGSGKMRVIFNHAYVSELVDTLIGNYQQYDPRRNPILKVEIAFTAYNEECSEDPPVNSNSTEIPPEENEKRLCLNYHNITASPNRTCINSKLFCDDVQHCGGDTTLLGWDESNTNCPNKPVTTTTTTDKPTEAPVEDYEDEEEASEPTRKVNPTSLSRPTFENRYFFNERPYALRPQRRTTTLRPRTSFSTSDIPEKSTTVQFTKLTDNIDYTWSESSPPSFFNKADLTNAISSVIYGVAVFIIFTVFMTVCFVCISKRIQQALCKRSTSNRANINNNNNTNSCSIPATLPISPSTTTTVITHNSAGSSSTGDLAYSPQNTTVVLVTLPQNVEPYDQPPSYDTLFPTTNSN